MTKQELFLKADNYKKRIEASRPFPISEIRELDDYFKIGLTYSSNAIEGNTLTISETKVLIEDGITVGGKPIRDCLEAIGHAKAYDFMLKLARNKTQTITEENILQLHFLFYNGIDSEMAGKYRNKEVYLTGTEKSLPSPKEIPELMKEFIMRMDELKGKLHPIEYAALLHKKLVDIHPFVDGNGRTARLLMNLSIINSGYGIVCISPVLRNEYINSLRLSDNEKVKNEPFVRFLTECVIETERDYCRLLKIPDRVPILEEVEEMEHER